jgi:Rps23 Pro-64 3,4-dihydroxylase Tpa1-like proline 4-hydroxylase
MSSYTYGENFLTAEQLELVWQEVDLIFNAMSSPEDCGAAENKKSGKGFFADEFIANLTLPTISNIGKSINHPGKFSLLVNYYGNNDYYKPHTDDSVKTLTVFLSKEEDAFTGGEFKFNDLNTIIPFRNNSYVLFDQGLTHEVTPVRLKKHTGRYSLTYFYY